MESEHRDRYSHLAPECAEAACQSMAAWCKHGFSAGFFFVALPRIFPLPTDGMLRDCLASAPSLPHEAEDRLSFCEALLAEAMSMQEKLLAMRWRRTKAGMACSFAAASALLACFALLLASGHVHAAAGILSGSAAAWTAGRILAARREARLSSEAGQARPGGRFLPWA